MPIRKELITLLRKGNAHVSFNEAVSDIPFELVAKRHKNLPYSIWDLTEHIRISQKDLLNFCQSAEYQSPKWPEEYWPKNKKPAEDEWGAGLLEIEFDREEIISMIRSESEEDLFKPFPYGNGQSLFREALVLADHNSYHTGQIIVLRRLFGAWK